MPKTLRKCVNADSLFSDIQLKSRTSLYNNKVWVLLEGWEDKDFYFKFFNHETTEFEICDGCSKVKSLNELLSTASIIHIVILDSDFKRLNKELSDDPNFFYADGHDHEMMCLQNLSTRQELLSNFSITYENAFFDRIFDDLKILSCLKWCNFALHLGYVFKTFSVDGKTSSELHDYEQIILFIEEHSESKDRPDFTKSFESFKYQFDENIYDIVNGHDCLKRICYYIKQQDSNHNTLNDKHIMCALHGCYNKEKFESTELYQSLTDWQDLNNKNILS